MNLWKIETDDFETIKDMAYDGRMFTLKLIFSFTKWRWLYVATYDPFKYSVTISNCYFYGTDIKSADDIYRNVSKMRGHGYRTQ